MRTLFDFTLGVSMALSLMACQKKVAETDYVARIGDTILTPEDLERRLSPVSVGQPREALVEEAIHRWAERELLFQEAVIKGLTQDLDLKRRVADYRKSLYGSTYLDMYLSNKVHVTTEEVRDHYKKNRESFRRPRPEAQVLHFVVPSEDEGIDVRNRLLSYDGEVRQDLLRHYRVDAKTVAKGGLMPELDQKLFGPRQPRGVIGPVQSPYGFHVLELLEYHSTGSYRGLDEVYDEVSQELLRLKSEVLYMRLIDSLETVYSLEINRDYGVHD